jgi:hypothetical protein
MNLSLPSIIKQWKQRRHLFLTFHIDKELTSTRFWRSRIRHGKCSCCIGNRMLRLSHFVWNTSILVACVHFSVATGKRRASRRSSRSGFRTTRIPRVRTAKLIHKVGDDAMEMNVIVKSAVGQIDKVSTRNGHLFAIDLGLSSEV